VSFLSDLYGFVNKYARCGVDFSSGYISNNFGQIEIIEIKGVKLCKISQKYRGEDKMPFYAVANGKDIGVFSNWNDCNNSVKGYKNALYKKFEKKEDADEFVCMHHNPIVTDNDTDNDINNENTNIQPSIEFIPDYYVYTDGSCSNNGKDSALAGIGIFFAIDDPRNVSKRIEGKQTNNAAELSAVIETFGIIESDVLNGIKIGIVSDSEYVIKCVSSYGEKCCKKDWNVDIPNKELVKTAYELYRDKPNVQFIHIKAHTNNNDVHSFGNENADKLANMAIGLESCPYNTPIGRPREILTVQKKLDQAEEKIKQLEEEITVLKHNRFCADISL
jgi:ribonuclease HI